MSWPAFRGLTEARQSRRKCSIRYVIHVTTLREPIRFFAKGRTREETRAEALAFIYAWPLKAKNQPCGFRIEESRWLFPDIPPTTKGDHPR